MSGAADGPNSTAKLQEPAKAASEPAKEQPKAPAPLEEDDEFEDFPVEDWDQADTEVLGGNTHLWDESWDDDEASEDFSKQLKEELKKVEANK